MLLILPALTKVPGVFLPHREKAITVGIPRVEKSNGVSRATADVDGTPLWFESADIDLTSSAEAFASAMLFSSVHRRRPLISEAPLSGVWMDNVERLQAAWKEWWGYSPCSPIGARRADSDNTSRNAALMFSAGVDSYHSLLGGSKPDMLVSVHGFDIPLNDEPRMESLVLALHETATAHGVRPVVIRTNLREHPSIGKPHLWERAHGGALAAVGHLLSRDIGRLMISASWFIPDEQPWGSHSQTDRFFSTGELFVDHVGADIRREDKVALVAADEIALRHVRVCYKNVDDSLNCSRCEKCVVTMMHLMENGVLDECHLFDGSDLAARVSALPFIHYYYNISRRILARGKLEPSVELALAKVLRRSRRAHALLKFRSRIRQAVGRYV
jgi:hypothetical protein